MGYDDDGGDPLPIMAMTVFLKSSEVSITYSKHHVAHVVRDVRCYFITKHSNVSVAHEASRISKKKPMSYIALVIVVAVVEMEVSSITLVTNPTPKVLYCH